VPDGQLDQQLAREAEGGARAGAQRQRGARVRGFEIGQQPARGRAVDFQDLDARGDLHVRAVHRDDVAGQRPGGLERDVYRERLDPFF
jgi:hypothetical protein